MNLDENKTDHARFSEALARLGRCLRALVRLRGGCEPEDWVFVDEHGRPLQLRVLADKVRDHLAAAGIVRPDLTTVGPNKGRFGLHCFRRSFVTRSLAIGHTEDWVRLRSGHKGTELYRYRQEARALAELT